MVVGSNKVKRSIPFTEAQFLALLKTVHLGELVANDFREGKPLKEYADILQYLFSFAQGFGLGELPESLDAIETETDVRTRQEEYDDNVFWSQLAERMGTRDFYREHTEEEIKSMPADKLTAELDGYTGRAFDELKRHGIDRLKITEEYDDNTRSS